MISLLVSQACVRIAGDNECRPADTSHDVAVLSELADFTSQSERGIGVGNQRHVPVGASFDCATHCDPSPWNNAAKIVAQAVAF